MFREQERGVEFTNGQAVGFLGSSKEEARTVDAPGLLPLFIKREVMVRETTTTA